MIKCNMSTTMNSDGYTESPQETELRELVARRLRLPRIPDVVWNHLDAEECCREALKYYDYDDPRRPWGRAEDEVNDLVAVVERLMEVYGGESHEHPGRSVKRHWESRLSDNEHLRSVALAEHFARLAMRDGAIERFRYRVRTGGAEPHLQEVETAGLTIAEALALRQSSLSSRPALAQQTYAPLTDAEAGELLASEATRYMSFEHFERWSIPVLGHRAHRWIDGESNPPKGLTKHRGPMVWLVFEAPRRESFVLRAPDMVIDGFKADGSRPLPPFPVPTCEFCDPDDAAMAALIRSGETGWIEGLTEAQKERLPGIRAKMEEEDALLPMQSRVHAAFANKLAYPRRMEGKSAKEEMWTQHEVSVWPNSVLDDLRRLAEALAGTYHWDLIWAVWFVLTGRIPRVKALDAVSSRTTGGGFQDAKVEFTVLPWVSSKTLADVYRHIQNSFLGSDNRPILIRNLELFRFVESKRAEDGTLPKWREMRLDWNKSRPRDWDEEKTGQKWEYAFEATMSRDYHRVRRLLLEPNWAPSPPKAQAKKADTRPNRLNV